MFADYEHYLIDCEAAALIIGLREMERGAFRILFHSKHFQLNHVESRDGYFRLKLKM